MILDLIFYCVSKTSRQISSSSNLELIIYPLMRLKLMVIYLTESFAPFSALSSFIRMWTETRLHILSLKRGGAGLAFLTSHASLS